MKKLLQPYFHSLCLFLIVMGIIFPISFVQLTHNSSEKGENNRSTWFIGQNNTQREVNVVPPRFASDPVSFWNNRSGNLLSFTYPQAKNEIKGSFAVRDGWILVIKYSNGTNLDGIFVTKLLFSGETSWGTIIFEKYYADQYLDGINTEKVSETMGVVVWGYAENDTKQETYYITAQAFNLDTGAILWDPAGVVLQNGRTNTRQTHFKVCADSNANVYVAWDDNTRAAFSDVNIRAQKLTNLGIKCWGPNGTFVVNETSNQVCPRIMVNSSGYLFVFWSDFRVFTGMKAGIMGQCMNPTGSAIWQNNGSCIFLDEFNPEFDDFRCFGHDNDANGAVVVFQIQYNMNMSFEIRILNLDCQGINLWGSRGYLVADNDTILELFDFKKADNYFWILYRLSANSVYSIWVQKFSFTGEALWGSEGKTMYESENAIYFAQFWVGRNEIIIAWPQLQSGSIFSVFCSKWNEDGSLLMDVYPLFVGNFTLTSTSNIILVANLIEQTPINQPIGSHGVLIIWMNLNGSRRDIMGQYISTTPFLSSPIDLTTTQLGTETISWRVWDNVYSTGEYRVFITDPLDQTWLIQNWCFWQNNTNLIQNLNRSRAGDWTYRIEIRTLFFNNTDSVVVNMIDEAPTIICDEQYIIIIGINSSFNWYFDDDFNNDSYRVLCNDSVIVDWQTAGNNSWIQTPVLLSEGKWIYKIELKTPLGQYTYATTQIHIIRSANQTSSNDVLNDLANLEAQVSQLSTLIWIVGLVALILIGLVLLMQIRIRKQFVEVPQKPVKKSTSESDKKKITKPNEKKP